MTESDDGEDIQEVDVPLNRFDMDHLSVGQPVFKPVGEDTRLVLCFDEFQEWNRVPIAELEQLVDQWREKREDRPRNTRGNIATLAYSECAEELEAVLEDYE